MAKINKRSQPTISARQIMLAVRNYRGLSQRAVEKHTGIQSSTISDAERGVKKLGHKRMARLGIAYRVDPRAIGAKEASSTFSGLHFGGDKFTDGLLLKMIRKMTGLSQAKVGALIGTKAPNICMIENGKTNLGPKRAARLIKALKVQFPAFSALWT